jgi:hypothetical protein
MAVQLQLVGNNCRISGGDGDGQLLPMQYTEKSEANLPSCYLYAHQADGPLNAAASESPKIPLRACVSTTGALLSGSTARLFDRNVPITP